MMTMTPDAAVFDSGDGEQRLCAKDFSLLARPFLEAITPLFPSGLRLEFCSGKPETEDETAAEQELILPLPLDDPSPVGLRLSSTDPALLAELSGSWLEEQIEEVLRTLSLLRPAFIDCAGACYNLRALPHALRESRGGFFLLRLGCIKKNITDTLRSSAEAAIWLRHNLAAALFSCGFGLFAALSAEDDMESARRSARLVQRRLRQDGMSRVQILYLSAERAQALFAAGGLAAFHESLAAVDRQGPFGFLCASEGGDERRTERFRLPGNDIFRQLQQKWRGQTLFSLIFLRLETEAAQGGARPPDFSSATLPLAELQQYGDIWYADPHTLVCFLAGQTPTEAGKAAAAMIALLQRALPEASIAAGIAGWPCLDFAKKNIPANCLKALLHAALLGPGQQVLFDHLSLNVSGDSYFEEGDYRHAIREYRRGLQLQPDDVNLLNSLGVTLAAYGQEYQASACFRRALQLEADNHMALANLGYTLLHQGKDDEALVCLSRAHAAFPPDEPQPRELLQPLVRLYLERGQWQQALSVLERWPASEGMEHDALYHRQLGLALEGCGIGERAMRAFEQALKLSPQDAVSLGHLGGLYLSSGEGKDLGLHLCQQAVRLRPQDAVLWRLLTAGYVGQGNWEAAAMAIERCLRLRSDDAQSMLLAATICQQKKNDSQARYWLNRAMKLHTISAELRNELTQALAGLAKGNNTGTIPQAGRKPRLRHGATRGE